MFTLDCLSFAYLLHLLFYLPVTHCREQDFELVVAPNGIVYMVDTRESDSRKVMWSFSSGPPIYKSYQAPIQENDEKDKVLGHSRYAFLECGDDWELYLNHEYGKVVSHIS